jgi:hypothetical protein
LALFIDFFDLLVERSRVSVDLFKIVGEDLTTIRSFLVVMCKVVAEGSDETASDSNLGRCRSFVAGEHPHTHSRVSKILNALMDVVLQQVFSACCSKQRKSALEFTGL